ncbi:MAG: hypothetical protein JWO14_2841 [Solirubrobacterales bacterium]|nr:hypothetical protein [Solirubrobacterales bacterium]
MQRWKNEVAQSIVYSGESDCQGDRACLVEARVVLKPLLEADNVYDAQSPPKTGF